MHAKILLIISIIFPVSVAIISHAAATEENDIQAINQGASVETESQKPKLIPVSGFLRSDEIAIPADIPGYRLFQLDRKIRIPGTLENDGTFEAVLPLYVYYPSGKTINMANQLNSAVDSLEILNNEIADLKRMSGQSGSRLLNEHLEKINRTLKTLQAIQNEEIGSFSR